MSSKGTADRSMDALLTKDPWTFKSTTFFVNQSTVVLLCLWIIIRETSIICKSFQHSSLKTQIYLVLFVLGIQAYTTRLELVYFTTRESLKTPYDYKLVAFFSTSCWVSHFVNHPDGCSLHFFVAVIVSLFTFFTISLV